MHSLPLRLIIPRCNKNERINRNSYYCSLSYNEENLRTFLLQESFRTSYSNPSNGNSFRVSATQDKFNIREKIDTFPHTEDKFLVVTSNNFFSFSPTRLGSSEEFVRYVISHFSLNQLNNKKPLLLGFDVLNSHICFNPYDGIDAIVAALSVKNNEFQPLTSIWECWQQPQECNNACLIEQHSRRVINATDLDNQLDDIRLSLFSCGDICSYCHNFERLPEADIYIDLSHISLSGHTCQNRTPRQLLQENYTSIVIITQQVNSSSLKRYLEEGYPYVFVKQSVNVYMRVIPVYDSRQNQRGRRTLLGVFVDLVINL